MDFHVAQSSHSGVCQMVAALLLRVSPLRAGASIILLLPDIASSGDGAYQAVVPFRVEVEASPIGR